MRAKKPTFNKNIETYEKTLRITSAGHFNHISCGKAENTNPTNANKPAVFKLNLNPNHKQDTISIAGTSTNLSAKMYKKIVLYKLINNIKNKNTFILCCKFSKNLLNLFNFHFSNLIKNSLKSLKPSCSKSNAPLAAASPKRNPTNFSVPAK